MNSLFRRLGPCTLMGISALAAAAPTPSLMLILTTPDLLTPPPGYTVLKIVSATTGLPEQIHGPLDNPALQDILKQAEALHASALLGLNCQTNGRSIACSSLALAHDFSSPTSNVFDDVTQQVFGNAFYQDPMHYPSPETVGHALSVTFYLAPTDYRTVSGESVAENREWWGLRRESHTVEKPRIPALCIDSLYFLKALNGNNPGLVNFNCFPSTSTLPGYIQINATADEVQKN